MAAGPRTLISRDDCLALERASDQKHEYVAGEVRAMVGGSPRHGEMRRIPSLRLATDERGKGD